jgi:hypothetical protein
MRVIRGVLAAGVVMGLAMVGATSPADASLLMRLTSEGTVKTISDGDGDGSVFYDSAVDGDVGSFTLLVVSGLSKPTLPASSSLGSMNLAFLSFGSGQLVIELTDTDFPAMPEGGGELVAGALGLLGAGTLTADGYKNLDNSEFATNPAISVHLGPFMPDPFMDSESDSHGPIVDPYSMTMVITIDHGTAEADTSADSFLANVAQDNVVPAPPTLALAGIGISGLGLFGMIRRRRRA